MGSSTDRDSLKSATRAGNLLVYQSQKNESADNPSDEEESQSSPSNGEESRSNASQKNESEETPSDEDGSHGNPSHEEESQSIPSQDDESPSSPSHEDDSQPSTLAGRQSSEDRVEEDHKSQSCESQEREFRDCESRDCESQDCESRDCQSRDCESQDCKSQDCGSTDGEFQDPEQHEKEQKSWGRERQTTTAAAVSRGREELPGDQEIQDSSSLSSLAMDNISLPDNMAGGHITGDMVSHHLSPRGCSSGDARLLEDKRSIKIANVEGTVYPKASKAKPSQICM
jgi:hypothetical protein